MKTQGIIVLAPATFGYGPASHAVSIARALRSQTEADIWAVADGPSVSYLERSGRFDKILRADPDNLPDETQLPVDLPCVVVAVTDFARAVVAKKRGFPVVVVDALYWMWDSDPIDVRTVDAYLCLAFSGVRERIGQVKPPSKTLKEIPQIAEQEPTESSKPRNGVIVNLGGGITPFGFSYDYAAVIVQSVQEAMAHAGYRELLVTCSEVAQSELVSRGVQARLESLTLHDMINELQTRSVLVTLPGLSIMWDALGARIPTFVVPGISYSQHQLVKEYIQFFEGVSFFTWDDLPGYGLLPAGMDENAGVQSATALADRFANDRVAIGKLSKWLSDELCNESVTPSLQSGHSWGDFSGAEEVANEVLKILGKF